MADLSNYGNAKTDYAGGVPVQQSPFDRLTNAVSDLRDMQKMARAIADRLTGAQPDAASVSGLKEIGGGGLIDGVERQITLIREIQGDIYASLSRIENRL